MSEVSTQQSPLTYFPREARVAVGKDCIEISISTDYDTRPTRDFLEAISKLEREGIRYENLSHSVYRRIQIPFQQN